MKVPPLKVVVVEDNADVADFLKHVLEENGHTVIGTAATGPEMVKTVLTKEPDIVVFDIHLPGMDGLDALKQISREVVVPAVAVTGDRVQVERALEDNILGYLLKPVTPEQLMVAVQVAWARFQEYKTLRDENQNLQETLKARKLIEQAKGILMRRYRWSEKEAFRKLQKTAMDYRTTMARLARDVLDGKNVEFS